ncbi:DUF3899 domain-containing protein [Metabacillus halosaccharovorans]|uniref:DUF3899 domain-containing protein n=1 Tax=Metabacillus halosaccharovorans TaxID=930124 RepID=A0ABT3DJ25_9BACI|nr:DUF3899 domain-containing protein [Metabacillus halosaccharovorans]MCV9887054.1 DUF3899 domain-containing protein [Metabacillus halosaccharovorans]
MRTNRSVTLIIVSLCLTNLLSFIIYQKLTILSFINISFFFALGLLFISFFTITVKGGFFDGITYGFRRMFVSKGKELSKQEVNEMTPVSELLTFDHSPFLTSGLVMTGIVVIGTILYYYI